MISSEKFCSLGLSLAYLVSLYKLGKCTFPPRQGLMRKCSTTGFWPPFTLGQAFLCKQTKWRIVHGTNSDFELCTDLHLFWKPIVTKVTCSFERRMHI